MIVACLSTVASSPTTMLGIDDIQNWPDERLAEGDDDDDDFCAVKYAERRRRVRERKAEEERRKVEEERRKAEEEEKRKAEEARKAAAEARHKEAEEAAMKRVGGRCPILLRANLGRPSRSAWSRIGAPQKTRLGLGRSC